MKKATNEARPVPNPPSGGAWTFDEAQWAWVSNDRVPARDGQASAEPATTNVKQEQ